MPERDPASDASLIGRTLSRYRIAEKIGQDGTGVVYRARDDRLGRDVAIKVLPARALSDDKARERFRREALALSNLSHPNIAVVHDLDTQDGADFVVMEFLSGATLADCISSRRLSEKEILDIGMQIADALDEAHESGVVHRDLKPGNIMLDPKGRVKVLDFGLARFLLARQQDAATATLTQAQRVVGTLPYLSPELVRGDAVDKRSDIYALGAVLYESATRRRPFGASGSAALAGDILHKAPRSPREHNAELSAELARIILKCLEKKPADRYRSARELAEDLRRLDSGLTAGPGPWRVDRSAERRRLVIFAALAVVLALAVSVNLDLSELRDRLFGGGKAPEIDSIAVLPLENLSGDPEQEYYADGMTEALISGLGEIDGLRVISRTSVMGYKEKRKALGQIAEELAVDGVVEGSVLRADDTVQLTARLLRAETDSQIWSARYERDMSDILSLQHEAARAIAGGLRRTLARHGDERPRRVLPEAHEAYLRGRYLWNTRGVDDARRAVELLEQAVSLDPDYAAAYAGLAGAHILLAVYGDTPPRQTYPRAESAARRAIELDEFLAEAHASIGAIAMDYHWDRRAAETSLRRAIELNPSYSTAHLWLGNLLNHTGRFEEALEAGLRVKELDPLSASGELLIATSLYYMGRFEEAIVQLQTTSNTFPDYPSTRIYLILAHAQLGESETAIVIAEEAANTFGLPDFLALLGYVYALAGRQQDTRKTLRELEQLAEERYVTPFVFVPPYLGLADLDQAMEWLERSYEERAGHLAFVGVEPMYEPMRSDPRFNELVRRVGFIQ